MLHFCHNFLYDLTKPPFRELQAEEVKSTMQQTSDFCSKVIRRFFFLISPVTYCGICGENFTDVTVPKMPPRRILHVFFFKCPSIFHNWWQCSRGKCKSNWSTDLLHFFTRWEWGRAQWWHDFFRIGGMDSEFSRFPRFWAIDLVQLEIHTNPARNFMDTAIEVFLWIVSAG